MIIYKDVVSGDEMISDAFDMTLVGDVVYEVDCKMITVKGADVDIGANASAEETPETLEDGQEVVNNIVYSFRLTPTSFDRDSYLTYLKGYMKSVKAHLTDTGASPEELQTFQAGAKKFVSTYCKKEYFPKWEFYIGESMDVDGMVVLLNYREDGATPYMVFWKHGLKEEKV